MRRRRGEEDDGECGANCQKTSGDLEWRFVLEVYLFSSPGKTRRFPLGSFWSCVNYLSCTQGRKKKNEHIYINLLTLGSFWSCVNYLSCTQGCKKKNEHIYINLQSFPQTGGFFCLGRGHRLQRCHEEVLYFQLLIPPKRFDIFSP